MTGSFDYVKKNAETDPVKFWAAAAEDVMTLGAIRLFSRIMSASRATTSGVMKVLLVPV